MGIKPSHCYLTRRKRKLSGWKLKAFDEFWAAFRLKKGRAEAADAWLDIPELTPELADRITRSARREAGARPALVAKGQTPKWAQGWLSARRWEDWEEDGFTARSRNLDPGQMEKGEEQMPPNPDEKESEYRESLRKALKRFL